MILGLPNDLLKIIIKLLQVENTFVPYRRNENRLLLKQLKISLSLTRVCKKFRDLIRLTWNYNSWGPYPLLHACKRGFNLFLNCRWRTFSDVDFVSYLMSINFNPYFNQYEALRIACKEGHTEIVTLLLQGISVSLNWMCLH